MAAQSKASDTVQYYKIIVKNLGQLDLNNAVQKILHAVWLAAGAILFK